MTASRALRLRQELARRWLRGERPAQICAALGITRRRYGRLSAALLAEWQAALLPNLPARALELARVDWLSRVAAAHWQRTSAHSRPDFQAIRVLQWCVDRRLRLLGLDHSPPNLATPDLPLRINLHWADEELP